MSLLFRHQAKPHSHRILRRADLASLNWARPMGGGPRTFPGGLNKWQWRRLHEKKAREKETRLLKQEKQLYQARLRSSLRASAAGQPNPGPAHSHSHTPLSPRQHVSALADRFFRAGAEDLWNEADGPLSRPPPDPPAGSSRWGVPPTRSGPPGGPDRVQTRGYCSFSLGRFRNCGDLLKNNNRGIYSYSMINELNKHGNVNNSGDLQQRRGYTCVGLGSSRICGDLLGNNNRDIYSNLVINEMNKDFRGDLEQKRGYSLVGLGNFRNSADLLHKNDVFTNSMMINELHKDGNLRGFRASLEKERGYSLIGLENKSGGFSNLVINESRKDGNTNDLGDVCGNSERKRGFSLMGLGNFRNCGDLLKKRDVFSNSMVLNGGNMSDLGNVKRGIRSSLTVGEVVKCGILSGLRSVRGFGGNLEQRRGFSSDVRDGFIPKVNKRRRGGFSSDDDDEHFSVVSENARWPKFKVEEDVKKTKEEERQRTGARGFIGSGVLGKYDVKTTKRQKVREVEGHAGEENEGEGLTMKIEEIRQEFMYRKKVKKAQEEDTLDLKGVDDFVARKKRFDECGISPLTVKALTNAGYLTMTRVQEATLSLCMEGKDVLVKARAGTGKTAAFLLPAIETVLQAISSQKVHRVPPIYVLIMCPTSELASQIAAETRVLLRYHEELNVQMLSGGTRFKNDLRLLECDPCQFLVATPGRLLDHIESRSGLSTRLMGLKMLVVDEADHLMSLGCKADMEKIVDCIPRQRQSLLFSATVSKEVRRMSQLVLHREHVYIDTLDEGSLEISSKVKQSYIVAPHDMHFQVVYKLLKQHILKTPDYKVIVFCTTGMVTSLMYQLFREMGLNVKEIHSRKPKVYRNRIVNEFKQLKELILISSDVSARGIHYPDVSLVIQVGIPSDKGLYIHRTGRTGREGKAGEGILVLAPWEEYFLEEIKNLQVESSPIPCIDEGVKLKMEDSMSKVDRNVKEAAYFAWLGYYNTLSETGRDKTSLVQRASQFSESIGLKKPPAIFRKTAIKMGLNGVPGIQTF